jgi:hypothetical protein
MTQIKFNGSIKQFTPKKLVSGDNGIRLLLEIPMPNQETLDGISGVFLSKANLTENVIITLEI